MVTLKASARLKLLHLYSDLRREKGVVTFASVPLFLLIHTMSKIPFFYFIREERIPVGVLRKRELKWLDMLENWEKWMSKRFKKVSCSYPE